MASWTLVQILVALLGVYLVGKGYIPLFDKPAQDILALPLLAL